MAKHKAPTSITIASTTDRTALHAFVEENWKTAALVAAVMTVVILGRQYFFQRAETSAGQSWDRLREDVPFVVKPEMDGLIPSRDAVNYPSSATLAAMADELRDDPAGPWAKALEVGALLQGGDQAAALAMLGDLESQWPDHPIVDTPLPYDSDGEPRTLREHVEGRMQEIEAWESAHPLLFSNPPLPDGSPRVRLVTSEGTIVVGLFMDEAPKHVENFLALCREGFYDGTKFHRVLPGHLIQGGDPNTIEGDPETWGQGGPDHKVDPEPNGLRHFSHVLAMAKMGAEAESSGSQFYITSKPQPDFDELYVVFGTVLEGSSVVDAMALTPVQNGDRPQNPAVLQSTEVLAE